MKLYDLPTVVDTLSTTILYLWTTDKTASQNNSIIAAVKLCPLSICKISDLSSSTTKPTLSLQCSPWILDPFSVNSTP